MHDQKPPGLILLEEFVTEDEEKLLLNCVDWKTTDYHLGTERSVFVLGIN